MNSTDGRNALNTFTYQLCTIVSDAPAVIQIGGIPVQNKSDEIVRYRKRLALKAEIPPGESTVPDVGKKISIDVADCRLDGDYHRISIVPQISENSKKKCGLYLTHQVLHDGEERPRGKIQNFEMGAVPAGSVAAFVVFSDGRHALFDEVASDALEDRDLTGWAFIILFASDEGAVLWNSECGDQISEQFGAAYCKFRVLRNNRDNIGTIEILKD